MAGVDTVQGLPGIGGENHDLGVIHGRECILGVESGAQGLSAVINSSNRSNAPVGRSRAIKSYMVFDLLGFLRSTQSLAELGLGSHTPTRPPPFPRYRPVSGVIHPTYGRAGRAGLLPEELLEALGQLARVQTGGRVGAT